MGCPSRRHDAPRRNQCRTAALPARPTRGSPSSSTISSASTRSPSASPGFVWRLKDETGNATQIAAYDDPLIIVNISVWTSPEALYEFAYRTMHRRFVQRRKEWFDLFGAAYLALWWIEEGRFPDVADGRRRLAHLERFGPTAYAFNFRKPFPATEDARPLGDVGDGRAAPESYRILRVSSRTAQPLRRPSDLLRILPSATAHRAFAVRGRTLCSFRSD